MFSRGEATRFIEKVFGSSVASNGGANVSVKCPICASHKETGDKKKLVIKTDNFFLHCWVCQYRSKNLVGLLKRYHPSFLNEYLDTFADLDFLSSDYDHGTNSPAGFETITELPPGFVFLAPYAKKFYQKEYIESVPVFKALSYLRSRGITERDFWFYRLGIAPKNDTYKDRIIFPSYDKTGKPNFFTTRTWIKGVKPKYKNPKVAASSIIFNEINIDWKRPLVLVEGPFDLLKCNDNSTCLLGSQLTTEYKLFQKIVEHNTPIILALDNDARKKTLNIAKLLYGYDIDVKIYKVPDQYGDVGEMTRLDFVNGLPEAMPFDMSALRQIQLLIGQNA